MKAGNFYYDWMMVYGGIFPTFPDAEHGKTWLKPWDFRVVKQTAEEITVSMSFTDDFAYAAAPKQFNKGVTGLRRLLCHAESRSRRARHARGAEESARKAIDYEYWTCTTLAPGSDPKIRGRMAPPKSSRRSRPTPRRAGRPISPTVTRAWTRRDTVLTNCATSKTGLRWASPTPRPTCGAEISGA